MSAPYEDEDGNFILFTFFVSKPHCVELGALFTTHNATLIMFRLSKVKT